MGLRNVYAIGDLAYMETPNMQMDPQVAQVAMQQADLIAGNLKFIERKSNPDKQYGFEYYDKGSMATVGRNLAVVDIPIPKAFGTKLHFGGFFLDDLDGASPDAYTRC